MKKKTSVISGAQRKTAKSKIESSSKVNSSPDLDPNSAPAPVSDPKTPFSLKPKADYPYSDRVSFSVWRKTEEAARRIAVFEVAVLLWDEHFTEKERERLGGDVYVAWKTPGRTVAMYMQVRGVDQFDAIIQVAYLVGFLREVDRDLLQREWGLPVGHISGLQRPVWQPKTGKLLFEKQIIRTVRVNNDKPSNICILIDRFDANEWPESIESPFSSPEQLNETLRELNKRLKRIRFHALSKGTMCRWDVVDS